ncbi:MAG: iron-containing alcohol dehydrogenase, partial [Bacillota bacterium]|nr:iron-containing alcohol dehydrogenase [Bacillota bacterium]
MKVLKLSLKHKTVPIEIENGLFQKAAQRIKELFGKRKIMLVTDSNVGPVYAEKLFTQMKDLNIETGIYTVPAGESSKNHEQLLKLYAAFANFGITRGDIVIAVGGGVTGDLAGYAASTWLRGTGFVQIPTSLLAMVDSSVG